MLVPKNLIYKLEVFPKLGKTEKEIFEDINEVLQDLKDYVCILYPKPKKPCPVCGSGDWSCGH